MNIEFTSPVDCLCDFTYDFYWQHMGKRLVPSEKIPGQKGTSYTYEELVSSLKRGEDVHIRGNAGKRLGSSLGVDLVFFGGTGKPLNAGSIIVDGNVDTRMGISMVSGSIYVKGKVKPPLGNVIEVASDRAGYRKYCSITGLMQNISDETVVSPNIITKEILCIKDGLIRDTIAARLDSNASIIVNGNAGMSTGILMKRGTVNVCGDAGMNTGVLMGGGVLTVCDTEEFAGAYMKGGNLVIRGKAKGYVGANMKGGSIYLKGKAMPVQVSLDEKDIMFLVKLLRISQTQVMMFKKYSI
ncbi:MAG: formylmethanofuran dehydrogenase [Candidatus Methanoperedens sp.]|nr:formylmethanofuran dehydrogenase [Candidatus Methanoperedens sp.]